MIQLSQCQPSPAWLQCQTGMARMEERAKVVMEEEEVTGVAGAQTEGEAAIVAGVVVGSKAMVVVVTSKSPITHLVPLTAGKHIGSMTASAL